jgi:hypothetical protein
LTYAQKLCCGAAQLLGLAVSCYKTHSDRKLLISFNIFLCLFSGHSSLSVEFQGLAALRAGLSTKLSTQNTGQTQTT